MSHDTPRQKSIRRHKRFHWFSSTLSLSASQIRLKAEEIEARALEAMQDRERVELEVDNLILEQHDAMREEQWIKQV